MRALLALALALALTPAAADAAWIARTAPDTVVVQGPITRGDAATLDQALAGPPARTVRLASPGGLVDEGMAMARTIRAHGLDTTVQGGAMCASACFMLFAAGQAKTVEPGARVGVHNASRRWGTDDEGSTADMVALVEGFGVPRAVIDRMEIQASEQIGWLSVDELRAMGASATPDALNTWSAPGAVYVAGDGKLQHLTAEEDRAGTHDALVRFKADPLYHAITGK